MDNANYYLLGYAYGLMAKRVMRGEPEDTKVADREHAQKIYSDLSLGTASKWPLKGIALGHFTLMSNKLMTDELSEELADILSRVDDIPDDDQATSGPERSEWQRGYFHAVADKKPTYKQSTVE